MTSFHEESEAFVKRGSYKEMPFKLAEVMVGLCRLLGLEGVISLRPEDAESEEPMVVISTFQHPGEMLPMLESLMTQAQRAAAEDVKAEESQ